MVTREIRTSNSDTSCDVCGRTLLRGEVADVYLAGGERRSVCELCKSRALHEGWVREGTVAAYESTGGSPERRRSLLGRLFSRREASGVPSTDGARATTLSDELDAHAWSQAETEAAPPARVPRRRERAEARRERNRERERDPEREGETRRERTSDRERSARAGEQDRSAEPAWEPRHVRAVPTSVEHKIALAIQLFNESDHARTVAGVARSLGPPVVAVHPSAEGGSIVYIVVSWELCWYRYEVELSDKASPVRPAGQGAELEELTAMEKQGNAVADEYGALSIA